LPHRGLFLLTNVTAGKWLGFNILPISALAAMSIAYTLGEGIGQTGLYQLRLLLRKTSGRLFPFDKYNISKT